MRGKEGRDTTRTIRKSSRDRSKSSSWKGGAIVKFARRKNLLERWRWTPNPMGVGRDKK